LPPAHAERSPNPRPPGLMRFALLSPALQKAGVVSIRPWPPRNPNSAWARAAKRPPRPVGTFFTFCRLAGPRVSVEGNRRRPELPKAGPLSFQPPTDSRTFLPVFQPNLFLLKQPRRPTAPEQVVMEHQPPRWPGPRKAAGPAPGPPYENAQSGRETPRACARPPTKPSTTSAMLPSFHTGSVAGAGDPSALFLKTRPFKRGRSDIRGVGSPGRNCPLVSFRSTTVSPSPPFHLSPP